MNVLVSFANKTPLLQFKAGTSLALNCSSVWHCCTYVCSSVAVETAGNDTITATTEVPRHSACLMTDSFTHRPFRARSRLADAERRIALERRDRNLDDGVPGSACTAASVSARRPA